MSGKSDARGGERVAVDVNALRRKVAGMCVSRLESEAGLAKSQVARILERGAAKQETIDDLCDALGIHESEILS